MMMTMMMMLLLCKLLLTFLCVSSSWKIATRGKQDLIIFSNAAASSSKEEGSGPQTLATPSTSSSANVSQGEAEELDRPRYTPDWKSLDSRPIPLWYRKAKLGIFVHWGVFSVPSFDTRLAEWFWYNWKTLRRPEDEEFMERSYPPSFQYQDFASDFSAELFNATNWAEAFAGSRARYVVLTSKHHDGFCLFPSPYSWNWNSVDVGPHRDLVGELQQAVTGWRPSGTRSSGEADTENVPEKMEFGLYYSLFEWYNPLYQYDRAQQYWTRSYPTAKQLPELMYLVESYQPSIVWSDGAWEASDHYFGSKDFLAYLYNSSPMRDYVVTNDRWGNTTDCKHGGVFNCQDRYNPGDLQKRYWENCLTIDKDSWGYRRNAQLKDYMRAEDIVEELVSTVAMGGNMLLNVGPAKDGTIPVIYQARLAQLGSWLSVNGDAIFGTHVWRQAQRDGKQQQLLLLPDIAGNKEQPGQTKDLPRTWYTAKCVPPNADSISGDGDECDDTNGWGTKDDVVFAIFLDWPENNDLWLASFNHSDAEARLLLPHGQRSSPLPIRTAVRPKSTNDHDSSDHDSTNLGVRVTLPSLNISRNTTCWGWALQMVIPNDKRDTHAEL